MGDEGTGQGRAGVVQKLPTDHLQWHLCQKQSFTRQWGTQGHMQDESQLHLPCGCELEGLGIMLSALEAF